MAAHGLVTARPLLTEQHGNGCRAVRATAAFRAPARTSAPVCRSGVRCRTAARLPAGPLVEGYRSRVVGVDQQLNVAVAAGGQARPQLAHQQVPDALTPAAGPDAEIADLCAGRAGVRPRAWPGSGLNRGESGYGAVAGDRDQHERSIRTREYRVDDRAGQAEIGDLRAAIPCCRRLGPDLRGLVNLAAAPDGFGDVHRGSLPGGRALMPVIITGRPRSAAGRCQAAGVRRP